MSLLTELINLNAKDENGKHGYFYYKQKYNSRFEYIGCVDTYQTRWPGSIWCNPYHRQVKRVIELYEDYIINRPELLAKIPTLRGKVLACWCKPELCHGDVLIKLLQKFVI